LATNVSQQSLFNIKVLTERELALREFTPRPKLIGSEFDSHVHCTKYAGLVSAVANIYASVIQGTALGPTSYIVTAADLHRVCAGNLLFKFADDTYLVVPSNNAHSCQAKIEHQPPTKRHKTKIFSACRNHNLGLSPSPTPPPRPEHRTCDQSAHKLGVIVVVDKLTAADHVISLLSSGSRAVWEWHMLRN